ncbi:MAG: hypothetical protein EZS28_016733 [Streblomastix strix]|uniref:Uncharacterized protein n=1 Tax=Streblomastix strix TaxID=222440 RepID=A0A5J4VZC2_9EUKA|nr:MAG: hypothetical protein EZS28_016729 [Streblomastix strix]KAA6387744.1 MAG: hypothetical protein EZS28_016733 [Streblomastix strix]
MSAAKLHRKAEESAETLAKFRQTIIKIAGEAEIEPKLSYGLDIGSSPENKPQDSQLSGKKATDDISRCIVSISQPLVQTTEASQELAQAVAEISSFRNAEAPLREQEKRLKAERGLLQKILSNSTRTSEQANNTIRTLTKLVNDDLRKEFILAQSRVNQSYNSVQRTTGDLERVVATLANQVVKKSWEESEGIAKQVSQGNQEEEQNAVDVIASWCRKEQERLQRIARRRRGRLDDMEKKLGHLRVLQNKLATWAEILKDHNQIIDLQKQIDDQIGMMKSEDEDDDDLPFPGSGRSSKGGKISFQLDDDDEDDDYDEDDEQNKNKRKNNQNSDKDGDGNNVDGSNKGVIPTDLLKQQYNQYRALYAELEKNLTNRIIAAKKRASQTAQNSAQFAEILRPHEVKLENARRSKAVALRDQSLAISQVTEIESKIANAQREIEQAQVRAKSLIDDIIRNQDALTEIEGKLTETTAKVESNTHDRIRFERRETDAREQYALAHRSCADAVRSCSSLPDGARSDIITPLHSFLEEAISMINEVGDCGDDLAGQVSTLEHWREALGKQMSQKWFAKE